ncbi:MAG: phosphorylcholine transferase LicD [Eubacterium sp.]
MKKIEKNEIQGLELNILKTVLSFFEKNNISYFTSGGTTLGSIRHGGFIPWDDDIDIYVPRKDYDRLLELADGSLIDGFVKFYKPGDKDYIYPFVKACNENTIIYEKSVTDKKNAIGIFVDIFPLDKYYDSKLKNLFLILKTKKYRFLLESASNQVNLSKKWSTKWIIKEAAYKLLKPFTKKWTVEKCTLKLDSIGREMEKRDEHFVGDLVFYMSTHDYYSIDYFRDFTEGKFEDLTIRNPIGYDKYLTEMYGDYMTPPPKDKQIMHGFECYFINEE